MRHIFESASVWLGVSPFRCYVAPMSEETWINITVVLGAIAIALLVHITMSFEERR